MPVGLARYLRHAITAYESRFGEPCMTPYDASSHEHVHRAGHDDHHDELSYSLPDPHRPPPRAGGPKRVVPPAGSTAGSYVAPGAAVDVDGYTVRSQDDGAGDTGTSDTGGYGYATDAEHFLPRHAGVGNRCSFATIAALLDARWSYLLEHGACVRACVRV